MLAPSNVTLLDRWHFWRVIIISSEWLNTFMYLNIRKLTKAKPNTYFNNLVLDLTDAEHYIYFNPQQLISIVNCDFIQYPILVCLLKHCLWHRNSSHPFSFKADCHIIAYRWLCTHMTGDVIFTCCAKIK